MTVDVEPGSFRDRNGRVYYYNDEIYRGLSQKAFEDWEALSATDFYSHYSKAMKIVPTEQVQTDSTQSIQIPFAQSWEAVLKHDRIPFISYPYEWSFSMLKDAALLQLELLGAALDEDMIVKDSSAYNIQWFGSQPVFIDIPSFEKLQTSEPWVGYRQFCQLFLYPLFLQAYKDVTFQHWLRGSIDGILPEEICNLLSTRDFFRPGVFMHVYMQNKMQDRHKSTTKNVKAELKLAGFSKELVKSNVKRINKLVEGLRWKRKQTEWSDYQNIHNYSDEDHKLKEEFVEKVSRLRSWPLVWDIGCNTGNFTRIVADNADCVVAMDADHLAIENLYCSLHRDKDTNILPLVINLADSSPNMGWRGLERKSLVERGSPDLTLCLALVHHIVIGANIPMAEFVQWLAGLKTALIIEFVTKEDDMVRTLLLNKEDHYDDYELEYFKKCLNDYFYIRDEKILNSKKRILFYAEPVEY